MNQSSTYAADVVEGCVDGFGGGALTGWAWFPESTIDVAVVELVVDEAIVARAPADRYRADLEAAGKRNGFCAFAVAYWAPPAEGAGTTVWVQVNGHALPGSPVVVQPAAAQGEGTDENHAVAPRRFEQAAGVVGVLQDFGPDRISGWAYAPDGAEPVVLSIFEGDAIIASFRADQWRTDLEDLRQGDGRCGFDIPVPAALRDGALHAIDIRIGDAGPPVIDRPLPFTVEAAAPSEPRPAAPPQEKFIDLLRRIPRLNDLLPLHFSIIVNFYNMQREAQRTLTSLSRTYQRGAENIRYEVLCIDNGSDPPLDEAFVESFGPEFKLVRPSRLLPSPCAAINEAARQARGRYVAIMIDGAHIVTPGVLAEAKAALDETPDSIVAIRHWFVGGDQRWFSSVGYSRAMEDILFDKIGWPNDGYELFQIGTPMNENPNHWFDPMAESNCLILPATLYEKIGGLDEAFSEPGGGYSNLDLLKRAAIASEKPITCLIGEATFHQFHHGMTTNVSDEEKEARVRAYANVYRELRGGAFSNIETIQLRLRGRIHKPGAISVRHQPLCPARLGVTDRVRPGDVDRHLDIGAQVYLESVYAECGLHHETTWLGEKISLAPADLVNIQDIVTKLRPARILTTETEPGFLAFLDGSLRLLGLWRSRIVCVFPDTAPDNLPSSVIPVFGDPRSVSTLRKIEDALAAEESVLVVFAPQADDFMPVDQIRAFANYVSFGSYFIFLRSVLGQPWLGYSKYWHLRAIHRFIDSEPGFVIDHTRNQHLISSCPSGYLQRVKGVMKAANADPSLDNLEAF